MKQKTETAVDVKELTAPLNDEVVWNACIDIIEDEFDFHQKEADYWLGGDIEGFNFDYMMRRLNKMNTLHKMWRKVSEAKTNQECIDVIRNNFDVFEVFGTDHNAFIQNCIEIGINEETAKFIMNVK